MSSATCSHICPNHHMHKSSPSSHADHGPGGAQLAAQVAQLAHRAMRRDVSHAVIPCKRLQPPSPLHVPPCEQKQLPCIRLAMQRAGPAQHIGTASHHTAPRRSPPPPPPTCNDLHRFGKRCPLNRSARLPPTMYSVMIMKGVCFVTAPRNWTWSGGGPGGQGAGGGGGGGLQDEHEGLLGEEEQRSRRRFCARTQLHHDGPLAPARTPPTRPPRTRAHSVPAIPRGGERGGGRR